MDLKKYEHAKFELASILRAAELLIPEPQRKSIQPFSDLYARLADDRFNLVVVGRFNRGKTSLMNAMMATERLPTGIVPLTSVITTVAYGSSEQVIIEYQKQRLPSKIGLDQLEDYVTQRGNPGNQRGVSMARVQLPADLLRRGFHFVDTPGLGSSILENTRTTEGFLPEADALILVTSYDSPLTEEEMGLLRDMALSVRRTFVAVNKHDGVTFEERGEVLEHIHAQLASEFGDTAPPVFSVSARLAIEAQKSGDTAQWADSGVPVLMEHLTRFLVEDKQAEFLYRMCERIADVLRDLPESTVEKDRLRTLRQELDHYPSAELPDRPAMAERLRAPPRFTGCPICQRIDKGIFDFLCKFQLDVAVRKKVREGLADQGGLCDFHTWLYQSIASPHGTCTGFPDVLDKLAERLRDAAAGTGDKPFSIQIESFRPDSDHCALCRLHSEIEQTAVNSLARTLDESGIQAFQPVCTRHLAQLVEALQKPDMARQVLIAEAEVLDRVSEDMRRFALRIDGIRRYLLTQEEKGADTRGLSLLAGHRNVTGSAKLR